MEINDWLFAVIILLIVFLLVIVLILYDYKNAYDVLLDGYNDLVLRYNDYECPKWNINE